MTKRATSVAVASVVDFPEIRKVVNVGGMLVTKVHFERVAARRVHAVVKYVPDARGQDLAHRLPLTLGALTQDPTRARSQGRSVYLLVHCGACDSTRWKRADAWAKGAIKTCVTCQREKNKLHRMPTKMIAQIRTQARVSARRKQG